MSGGAGEVPAVAPAGAAASGPAPAAPKHGFGWLVVLVLGVAVVLLRDVEGPIARWLDAYASLEDLPSDSQRHVDDLLLVPAASLLVVFCRVTLGLRMLGPFRPILIGLAFYQTGTVTGIVFLTSVLLLVAVVRPRRRGRSLLPYFGRLGALLSLVVLLELIVLLAGAAFESERLLRAAVFPIVVLCLSVDGFARVITESGLGPAVWRGVVTVAIAVGVSEFGRVDVVADFLFGHPEFVLVEIGLIMFVSTRMKWQLLAPYLPKEPDSPKS